MRIFLPTKTGRGKCCMMYGRGRAIHSMKRGGYVPLLLSPGLGASEGGSGLPSMKKIEETKGNMNNVIKKLENLHLKSGTKKKNISFVL